MATIDDKGMIDQLIRDNGVYRDKEGNLYPDDPPAVKITQYTNAWGVVTWGVAFRGEDEWRYDEPSPFIRDPKLIWERKEHHDAR